MVGPHGTVISARTVLPKFVYSLLSISCSFATEAMTQHNAWRDGNLLNCANSAESRAGKPRRDKPRSSPPTQRQGGKSPTMHAQARRLSSIRPCHIGKLGGIDGEGLGLQGGYNLGFWPETPPNALFIAFLCHFPAKIREQALFWTSSGGGKTGCPPPSPPMIFPPILSWKFFKFQSSSCFNSQFM